ncbi:hypothetical protein HOH45_00490 [bacterium]|jgi:hypothetical protein|nr:hypothetical protein [bacterium]
MLNLNNLTLSLFSNLKYGEFSRYYVITNCKESNTPTLKFYCLKIHRDYIEFYEETETEKNTYTFIDNAWSKNHSILSENLINKIDQKIKNVGSDLESKNAIIYEKTSGLIHNIIHTDHGSTDEWNNNDITQFDYEELQHVSGYLSNEHLEDAYTIENAPKNNVLSLLESKGIIDNADTFKLASASYISNIKKHFNSDFL